MNVLYIDTTTGDLVAALIKDKDIISVSQRAMGVKHSETLCGKVTELLSAYNLTLGDVDAYACAVGPGSFTGIRIGISTIKGYAAAIQKPYIAVNCLEAIARSANCNGNGRSVIDAGNGYYYFDLAVGTLPDVIPYEGNASYGCARADGGVDYLDGAAIIIREKFSKCQFESSLSPLYIRKSQAEINLNKADR